MLQILSTVDHWFHSGVPLWTWTVTRFSVLISLYAVVQKMVPYYFLTNSVKHETILIIYGTQNAEEI